MEFFRAHLHLSLKPLLSLYTSSLLSFVNPSKALDPKILILADGSGALFLTQASSPVEVARLITLFVAVPVLYTKLRGLSTKPFSELFVKEMILTTYSFAPAMAVKLALYVIRKDARINMEDRKERTLFIISTVALTALMTPQILKIHRKTYTFSIRELIDYSVTQIGVNIIMTELIELNAKIIEQEMASASVESVSDILQYQAIGGGVQRVINEKIDEAQIVINAALKNHDFWKDWMNEAPIKTDQITLPEEPNLAFHTFIQNNPALIHNLSVEKQSAWNRLFYNSRQEQIWPTLLTEAHIDLIADANLAMFHAYFTRTPFFFLLIEETRAAINERFALPFKGVDEPPLSRIDTMELSNFSPKHQHQFFSHQSENIPEEYRWSSLPPGQKILLNFAFHEHGLRWL